MLIGIVGKPSSGKSTFLNAACLTSAKTGNYPFTTIEPNPGTAFVTTECVCKELGVKDDPKNSLCLDGTRMIQVQLLDVAGLVPGAHEGRGRGNQFLSELGRADVLLHIVDLSGALDAEGNSVEAGTHDPLEDIRWLEDEIAYWFLDILTRKDWKKFYLNVERQKKKTWEAFEDRLSGLKVSKEHLINALKDSELTEKHLNEWSEEDLLRFVQVLRKHAKPIVLIGNKIDQHTAPENYERVKNEGLDIVPASALAEFWLRTFTEQGKLKYTPGASDFEIVDPALSDQDKAALGKIKTEILDQYGSTGIQRALNHAVFDVLEMITVFPVHDPNKLSDKDGLVLPDAFLIEKDTPIKEFVAKCIHTELAEGFVHGIDAKTKKRLGESYTVKNKDVLKIVSAKGR